LRARAIALLAAAALGVAACGDSEDNAELPPAVPAGAGETTATETTSTTTTTRAPARAGGKLEISKDRGAKPAIPKPSGAPPTKLVVQDVVKGSGRTAKLDDQVTVHYVGVTHSTGEEFDASWNGGKPAEFALSKGQLIDGWIEGIPGMKVGGRRLLIIPPELGYGAEGSPPSIGPNETLIFVIDLKKVG
jgi:peptidylprolyl isomerase